MGILDRWRLTLARCKTELVKQERLLLEEKNLLAEQERIRQERLAEQEHVSRENKYWAAMTVLENETRALTGEGDMKYILAGSTEGQMSTFERWGKDSNGRPCKYREFQRPAPTLIIDISAGVAFDVRTCKALADPRLMKPEQLRRILEAGGWPTRGGAEQSLLEGDIIGADTTNTRLVG